MYYNYRKERIKSAIIICLILFLAVFATHHIYYKFQNERNIDYSSESLDITFHEETGDRVDLTKVTPVTDAVGLSSTAYTFTIKNNMTMPVNYTIKIVDDIQTVFEENCSEYQMPKDIIRIGIREDNKKTEIYTLSELQKGILKETKIDALKEKNYTVRIWTMQSALQSGSIRHYHGRIQIVEDDTEVAILNPKQR